ncbi:tripartite tricarboxylate transporter TctB family protein [Amorphus orientalis]|uniref:DUF1468 domain-containing protein n=1 Tax=Amorphus orientalis TaxID=649198 RepID=A0AAE3VLI2_9HYPH|nr:tripartite tricarboxylate transporter TctB family protein [Amorphus orientalis]MDQ0314266.1 hypothetical protein [Amorphus orientalis]
MSNVDAGDVRARPSRTGDAIAAAIGLAAIGLFVAAPSLVDRSGPDPFYKGPLIFPLIALAITAAGALPSAFRLVTGTTRSWRIDGAGVPLRAIGLFALACLYAPAIAAFGLDAATFVFLFLGLLAAGYRRPLRALAVAVSVTLIMHLAFVTVLDIWFPTPSLAPLTFGG